MEGNTGIILLEISSITIRSREPKLGFIFIDFRIKILKNQSFLGFKTKKWASQLKNGLHLKPKSLLDLTLEIRISVRELRPV